MPHRVALLPALAACAALTTGCGLTDPYASRPAPSSVTSTATPTVSTNADPRPERDGRIPPAVRATQHRLAAGAGEPTPNAALERYARRYINWSAATVSAEQRQLAALSLGQARAQALQAATSTSRDATLRQSGVSNTGRLISISQSLSKAEQWVLVTSEQTTGTGDYAGLPPTLHVIYAEVTRTATGYVVSQWSPQN